MENKPKAIARGSNLQISFKQAVNIGRVLKGKSVPYAVRLLTDAIIMRRPIPTIRYGRDTSHKPGTAAGRYPAKASKEVLLVLRNGIANAKSRMMDMENLYISSFECNRTISKQRLRRRRIGRLTNIMIEFQEKEEEPKKLLPKKKRKPTKDVAKKDEKAKVSSKKKEVKKKPEAKKPVKKAKKAPAKKAKPKGGKK